MTTYADKSTALPPYRDGDTSGWYVKPGDADFIAQDDARLPNGHTTDDYMPHGSTGTVNAIMVWSVPTSDFALTMHGTPAKAMHSADEERVDGERQPWGMYVRYQGEWTWINFGFGYDRFGAVMAYYDEANRERANWYDQPFTMHSALGAAMELDDNGYRVSTVERLSNSTAVVQLDTAKGGVTLTTPNDYNRFKGEPTR